MIARKLHSKAELRACLEISKSTSLNYTVPEFGVDWATVSTSLSKLSSGPFFRVIEYNGEIVGWISASLSTPAYYSNKTALQLVYYHCTLKGYAAVAALKVAHRSMIDAARKLIGVSIVITSPCPHTPKCFNKILKDDGWTDYTYMLLVDISKNT